jgi:hypothetical protein
MIRVEYVDVETVKGWPRNPKRHDEPGLDASLERFGFTVPLMLDEKTGRLVAGHGRLEALLRRKMAGLPAPARVEASANGDTWKVPVLKGVSFANKGEAEAYLIADNRLTEQGGWDNEALLAVVKDLTDAGVTFEGTGFPADYAARLSESYEKVGASGNVGDVPQQKQVACPHCGAAVEVKRGLPGSVHAARVRAANAKKGAA